MFDRERLWLRRRRGRTRRDRDGIPNTELSPNGASTYEPLSTVWEGSDGELLEAMFSFYATIEPEPILDATYNAGRFWKGSRRRVVSMNIDPQYKPTIIGDNRKMTGVASAKFGAVVYDPPHVGPQGRDKSKKRFDVDFGATVECGKEDDQYSYVKRPCGSNTTLTATSLLIRPLRATSYLKRSQKRPDGSGSPPTSGPL